MPISTIFRRFEERTDRTLIGLMSGTSVDAIDAAIVRFSEDETGRISATLLAFVAHPMPPELRRDILALSHGDGGAADVSRLNVVVADVFADAAEAAISVWGGDRSEIDAVGSHGQTIAHRAGDTPPSTLQIGSGSVIARRLGMTVVSDFRLADMAVGGQGAPLVPYADWRLLTHSAKNRAIQNIGGIGNVTYLPANANLADVRGFDTGPGNMLIDRAVAWATYGKQTFDADGRIAAGGSVDYELLEWLVAHPFLAKTPPKSAGREEFGDAFFHEIVDWWRARLIRQGKSAPDTDLVTTLTDFTALSIADAYRNFLPSLPDELIVGGGGARNSTLLRRLSTRLPEAEVRTHEALGIDSDAKEAVAFALLAHETLLGKPSNAPSVTGASRGVVLGTIAFP